MKIIHNIPKYQSEVEREEKLHTIYHKIYSTLHEKSKYDLKKEKSKL